MYPVTDQDSNQLANSFTYHTVKEGQSERYVALRGRAQTLATEIYMFVPPSRERSLAITKLEEAIMWANKGIACNE